jgi:hypothetical protein
VPITGIFIANKWEKYANNWGFLMFYSEFFSSQLDVFMHSVTGGIYCFTAHKALVILTKSSIKN